VARHGWARGKVASLLVGCDALGIAIAAGACASLHSLFLPPAVVFLFVLQPILVYVLGGFRYSGQDVRLAPSLAAFFAGAVVLSVALASKAVPCVLSAAIFPAMGLIVVPVATRMILGRVVRSRAGRMRWLVLGTTECLERMWSDNSKREFPGDLVMLALDEGAYVAGVAGRVSDLDRFLNQEWTGIVVTNLEGLEDGTIRDLMMARIHGTKVYDLTEFYERYDAKVPIYHLQDGWVVLSHGFHLLHDQMGLRIKRIMDILLSAGMLILAMPVMACVTLAIKCSSPGPILFRQRRVKARGAVFTVLKFRTMQVGSENGDKYTQVNDRRVTAVGSFLRKSRLDELPQLLNILAGDMSFIGPRAEWTKCVEAYEHVIPFYHLRHVVKPGLTGWAQVNYPYGAGVDDALEKLQYDLYYIKNHSLWLDLLIVLKTVRVVLFGMGR
jgi:exopolysaccharide biosynthesis polyprenyl glycosylphosphotransferase